MNTKLLNSLKIRLNIIKMKKLVLIFFFISANCYSQEWVKYSDSIYSNIVKGEIDKAYEFLSLAELELSKNAIIRDTIYADFLFRKGLIKSIDNKNAQSEFLESINIWNESDRKNYYKLMDIHFLLANDLYYIENYDAAYKHYEEYYNINIDNELELDDSFLTSIYNLSVIDYYIYENFDKAKYYSEEFIKFGKDKAYELFDFRFSNVYKFLGDFTSEENVLLQFLNNYKVKNNDPQLLADIYLNLYYSCSSQGKIYEMVDYAKKILEVVNNNNLSLDEATIKELITSLSSANKQMSEEIYSDGVDFFAELDGIMRKGDFDLFKEKFAKYESKFIYKKKYNALFNIYTLSMYLYENNGLYEKEEIENQLSIAESVEQGSR